MKTLFLIKYTTILTFLILCGNVCRAQETGCFTQSGDSLTFETSVDFSNDKVFFIGEYSGNEGIVAVRLAMIKYFAKKYGITDVFMKMGFGAAWLYNRYLQSGDTTVFGYSDMPYSKVFDRNFWTQLRSFNRSFQNKIQIHGYGLENEWHMSIIKMLVPAGKEVPPEILPGIRFIDTALWLSGDHCDRQIMTDMEANRQAYKAYLGENYSLVYKIVSNHYRGHRRWYRNWHYFVSLKNETKECGIRKFIVFGSGIEANPKFRNELAWLLSRNHKYWHRLISVGVLCKNCYHLSEYVGMAPSIGNVAPEGYGINKREWEPAFMNDFYAKYFNVSCKFTFTTNNTSDFYHVSGCYDYLILMKDQLKH